jgi:NAD(P)-dependent dehydrogenase (short-subunit alcohol dehydrogenase family)
MSGPSQYLTQLFGLQNKTALVTGASLRLRASNLTSKGGSRGIGRQIAIALASAGADIILAQVEPLSRLADRADANQCSGTYRIKTP